MFRLPAQRASPRVKVWRKLQKYGVLPWKNSAYILPNTPGNLERFQWLTAEVRKYEGDASIIEVARIEGHTEKQMMNLFNDARRRLYERLIWDARLALRQAAAQSSAQRRAQFAKLNRRLAEIHATDAFGCAKRSEAEAIIKEVQARSGVGETLAPVSRDKLKQYRRRVWLTRPHPEVDRVGSAWLIKHFIDPKARFAFSINPEAHPSAVRFDMFEGEFTHVGEECTFETLMRGFQLHDKRLKEIAQIIHDADLEDNKFGKVEGKAIDLVLKGWGKMDWSDAKILQRGFDLYDALYVTLGR
jgi:hypothetical protein